MVEFYTNFYCLSAVLFFLKFFKKLFQSSKNLATLTVRIPLQSTNDGQKGLIDNRQKKNKKSRKIFKLFFQSSKKFATLLVRIHP